MSHKHKLCINVALDRVKITCGAATLLAQMRYKANVCYIIQQPSSNDIHSYLFFKYQWIKKTELLHIKLQFIGPLVKHQSEES